MRNINIFFLDSKEKRIILFFFFSSRRRHTRSTRDWSSDVCSSDLDAAYKAAYGHSMSAPALAGFSGAWALFHYVLPAAKSMKPADVAAAARSVHLARGGLPNGSGLAFGGPGDPDPGANLEAASVIWQWTKVNHRDVTWPPAFATAPLNFIPIRR